MPLIFFECERATALRKRAGHELVAEFYSICQMTAPPSWNLSLPRSRAAPRTELAKLSSACTTSGAVPPRTNTTFPPNHPACAGRRTTASRRNTMIWKIGGPWASWPGSHGTDGEWGRCAKSAFDDASFLGALYAYLLPTGHARCRSAALSTRKWLTCKQTAFRSLAD
jgi:hypothetical protein